MQTNNNFLISPSKTAIGKILASKMKKEFSQLLVDKKAQLCATVTMMFSALDDAYSKLSKMEWMPQKCWMYAGGDWVVFAGGTKAVFIEKDKANFN